MLRCPACVYRVTAGGFSSAILRSYVSLSGASQAFLKPRTIWRTIQRGEIIHCHKIKQVHTAHIYTFRRLRDGLIINIAEELGSRR